MKGLRENPRAYVLTKRKINKYKLNHFPSYLAKKIHFFQAWNQKPLSTIITLSLTQYSQVVLRFSSIVEFRISKPINNNKE